MSGSIAVAVAIPERERAWLEVEHGAIAHNVRALKELLADHTDLMAIVKADGYGLGAASVARTALAEGASSLGVATVQEGLDLRFAGIEAPILVLGYLSGKEAVQAAVQCRLTPTVCSREHALELSRILEEMAAEDPEWIPSLPIRVHLKVDTGMTRLGTLWQDSDALFDACSAQRTMTIAGIYSHLANADQPGPDKMALQKLRFDAVVDKLRLRGVRAKCRHLANSAATLADRRLHYDLVRVGLAIYGVCPADHLRARVDLKPAISVRARVSQIKDVPRGAEVSYGSTFTADRPLKVAVATIGYADGVPWSLSRRLEVLVHGRRVRQLGNITMDQTMIDVSDIPGVCSGDVVTLLGRDGDEEITVNEWAENLKTIPWEILCLFKKRLPRVAVNESPDGE